MKSARRVPFVVRSLEGSRGVRITGINLINASRSCRWLAGVLADEIIAFLRVVKFLLGHG